MNPEVILKRFTLATKNEPESSIPKQLTEESLWKENQTVLEGAVKDTSSKEVKSLSVTFHKLQVNQELKDYQIAGLESALRVREKQKKKSTILDLQQRKEYHGCAVFYQPRKIREALFRELTKQQEDEQEKARKAGRKENSAAAARYQKQIAKEAKAAREVTKKKKEKKAKAENLAAARAQKQ
jgi:hypothetical protein